MYNCVYFLPAVAEFLSLCSVSLPDWIFDLSVVINAFTGVFVAIARFIDPTFIDIVKRGFKARPDAETSGHKLSLASRDSSGLYEELNTEHVSIADPMQLTE